MVHSSWVTAGLVMLCTELRGKVSCCVFPPCKIRVCSVWSLVMGLPAECSGAMQCHSTVGRACFQVHCQNLWSVHATLFRHRVGPPAPEVSVAWLLDPGWVT